MLLFLLVCHGFLRLNVYSMVHTNLHVQICTYFHLFIFFFHDSSSLFFWLSSSSCVSSCFCNWMLSLTSRRFWNFSSPISFKSCSLSLKQKALDYARYHKTRWYQVWPNRQHQSMIQFLGNPAWNLKAF